MPFFNTRDEWCSGIASTGVYWSGGTILLPGQGGGAQWRTADEVIAQDTRVGTSQLRAFNVRTGSAHTLLTAPLYDIYGSGFGDWVVLSDDGGMPVVYDSFGRSFEGSGVGAIGPDGQIALKDDYWSAGPWDVVERDGTRWRLTSGDASSIHAYGAGRFTWVDAAGWHARGFPTPEPLGEPVYWFQYLLCGPDGDELWQLYQWQDRLLFHPGGDPLGYVVATGNTFRPDLTELTPTTLEAIWSVNQTDAPGAIVSRLIDLTAPRTDLAAIHIPPFGQPKFWGVIHGSSTPGPPHHGYGYAVSQGNTEVLFGDYTKVVVGDRKVIANLASINVPDAKRLGTWNDTVEEGPHPRFLYHDGPRHSGLGDVPLIQMYPFKGEPVVAFLDRAHDELDRWEERRKGCVFKYYIGNPPEDHTEAELERYFPAYVELLGRPDVDGGLAAFLLRPDGIVGQPPFTPLDPRHPRWQTHYNAVAQAVGRELPDFSEFPNPDPDPEDPDMAAVAPRLPDAFDGVNEIDAGNGEVGLEFKKLIHGHKKLKSTSNDGLEDYRPKNSHEDPNGDQRDWTPADLRSWEKYKKSATAYIADRGERVYVHPRA